MLMQQNQTHTFYRVKPTVSPTSLSSSEDNDKLCSSLNPNKASVPDLITSKDIKIGSKPISVGLQTIINNIIKFETYPSQWK